MSNTDSLKFIQIPVTQVSVEDFVRKVTEENFQLRQAIDEMANKLAMQKELIEQLKDEIAKLKGQKPKPNIRPSSLEGQSRKPNWHARIGLHKGQIKMVLFSLWVKGKVSADGAFLKSHLSKIPSETTLGKRSLDISRLASTL